MLLGIVPPISLFLLGQERLGEVFQKPFFLFANPMMMQFLAGVVIAKLRLERRLPRHGAGWGW